MRHENRSLLNKLRLLNSVLPKGKVFKATYFGYIQSIRSVLSIFLCRCFIFRVEFMCLRECMNVCIYSNSVPGSFRNDRKSMLESTYSFFLFFPLRMNIWDARYYIGMHIKNHSYSGLDSLPFISFWSSLTDCRNAHWMEFFSFDWSVFLSVVFFCFFFYFFCSYLEIISKLLCCTSFPYVF